MLDQSHCAAEIGAHLDLAATRLEEHMLQFGPPSSRSSAGGRGCCDCPRGVRGPFPRQFRTGEALR
jgi:hypothetical protein